MAGYGSAPPPRAAYRHPDPRGGIVAHIARAHLAEGNLTEAYFALLRDYMLDTT
ncbi:hypothetical protein ACFPK1_32075 [Actinomycetospora rhizophila]|uniref:Uncharacterized protein n=1 Tax=Actinomycetospora rhizophila TaxID=1416876 RepID=A0ABV9ZN95_9PSEU